MHAPIDAVWILHQHRPAFGPLAYLRFIGARHHVVNCRFPSTGSTGDYPQLQGSGGLVPARHILPFLSRLHGPGAAEGDEGGDEGGDDGDDGGGEADNVGHRAAEVSALVDQVRSCLVRVCDGRCVVRVCQACVSGCASCKAVRLPRQSRLP